MIILDIVLKNFPWHSSSASKYMYHLSKKNLINFNIAHTDKKLSDLKFIHLI